MAVEIDRPVGTFHHPRLNHYHDLSFNLLPDFVGDGSLYERLPLVSFDISVNTPSCHFAGHLARSDIDRYAADQGYSANYDADRRKRVRAEGNHAVYRG